MTTMLGKMARAYNARLTEQSREDYMRWGELGREERAWELEAMRAALQAIREGVLPDNDEDVDAPGFYPNGEWDPICNGQAKAAFTAMIDAILAEEPKAP